MSRNCHYSNHITPIKAISSFTRMSSPSYGSDSTLENSTYLWDKQGGGSGSFRENSFNSGNSDDDD